MLQLFVQHHSSLLHVSKHAPDCIGFTGAFETQRFEIVIFIALSGVTLNSLKSLILRTGCSRSCTVRQIERTRNLMLMPTLIKAPRQALCQILLFHLLYFN
jgi:hypothetical protein